MCNIIPSGVTYRWIWQLQRGYWLWQLGVWWCPNDASIVLPRPRGRDIQRLALRGIFYRVWLDRQTSSSEWICPGGLVLGVGRIFDQVLF